MTFLYFQTSRADMDYLLNSEDANVQHIAQKYFNKLQELEANQ